jgi:hypothetical protein
MSIADTTLRGRNEMRLGTTTAPRSMTSAPKRKAMKSPLVNLLSILTLASSLFACSKRGEEVDDHVSLYCSDVARQINKLSDNYQERLKLATTTLSEQQATFADVKYGIVDRDGRGERGIWIERAIGFCAGVKSGEHSQIDPLENRSSHASQTYVEQGGDLTIASKSLIEMATAMNDLQKLPFRHD